MTVFILFANYSMQIKKQFFNDQFLFFHRKTEGQQATKVFAKAGLDIVTSSMCRHQQWFRLDVQCSALVHNFNIIFSNEHLYRAGRAMNSLPSQILER